MAKPGVPRAPGGKPGVLIRQMWQSQWQSQSRKRYCRTIKLKRCKTDFYRERRISGNPQLLWHLASCRVCSLALLAHAQRACLVEKEHRHLAFLSTWTARAKYFRRPWSRGLLDHHGFWTTTCSPEAAFGRDDPSHPRKERSTQFMNYSREIRAYVSERILGILVEALAYVSKRISGIRR